MGGTSCNKRHKWGKRGNNLGEMGSTLYTQGRGDDWTQVYIRAGQTLTVAGNTQGQEGDMQQEESLTPQ